MVPRPYVFVKQNSCNKSPAQAFTPLADEKKMGTIWIFGYYGSGRGRCRYFFALKWGRVLISKNEI